MLSKGFTLKSSEVQYLVGVIVYSIWEEYLWYMNDFLMDAQGDDIHMLEE